MKKNLNQVSDKQEHLIDLENYQSNSIDRYGEFLGTLGNVSIKNIYKASDQEQYMQRKPSQLMEEDTPKIEFKRRF